ncbi:hypothetical protein R3P38DRAFT_2771168 [Favolaschia claudopus]|uniref:Uncharacterized protein n=1 Tax=Favolaschia claudopus TaxID=2862362 RepID=A0AAW0CBK6_9AGAR
MFGLSGMRKDLKDGDTFKIRVRAGKVVRPCRLQVTYNSKSNSAEFVVGGQASGPTINRKREIRRKAMEEAEILMENQANEEEDAIPDDAAIETDSADEFEP